MKFFLALSLILLSDALYSQTGELKGRITYSFNTNAIYDKITMWFGRESYMYKYIRNDENYLALFKKKTYTTLSDSLSDVERLKQLNSDSQNDSTQTWYGNLKDNVIIFSFFEGNTNKKYCVRDSITFVQWELLDDTSTVRNIKCQKAVGKYNGMQYMAWFAPSIPVSAAPLQFRGLPGLLIECTNLTQNKTLSMIELQWPFDSDLIIEPCSNSPFISMKEMNEIIYKQNYKTQAILQTIQESQKSGKKIKLQDVMKGN